MINLLPYSIQKSTTYARHNRKLVHWCVAMSLGVIGIFAIIIAGYYYINLSISSYESRIENSQQQLADQRLEETRQRIQEISNSTRLVSQVLSKEVQFSRLLQGIGGIMPPGSSLQNLSIGTLEGGIDLQAVAVNYQTATQVQVNLEDSENGVFDKADIVNITCTEVEESADSQYPCQVTIRALFDDDSPYLFTHDANSEANQ